MNPSELTTLIRESTVPALSKRETRSDFRLRVSRRIDGCNIDTYIRILDETIDAALAGTLRRTSPDTKSGHEHKRHPLPPWARSEARKRGNPTLTTIVNGASPYGDSGLAACFSPLARGETVPRRSRSSA